MRRFKNLLPHKSLVEADIVLGEHGQHLLLEGSRAMHFGLRFDVAEERVPVCQANGEGHVTLLPLEEGIGISTGSHNGHAGFLQMFHELADGHFAREVQRDVNVVCGASNGEADVIRMAQLFSNGRMNCGAQRIVLQHGPLALRAEDHVQQHMIDYLHGGTSIPMERVVA